MTKPTLFFPTQGACEDYRMRRFHSDYDTLSGDGKGVGASAGFFKDAVNRLVSLGENAIGVDIPGLGPPGIEDQKIFLAGPQFKNKPGNILQEPVAQFSLGLYNGPQSSWWSAKRQQNQPAEEKDNIAQARTTNSVWVTAKQNIPYKIKTEEKTVNKKKINVSVFDYNGKQESDTLWKMNILPNWDHEKSLDFSHTHEWGRSEDMFTKIAGAVGGLLSGASRFVQRIQSLNAGNNPDALSQIKADIAETYQQTNRLELTIPFTLFTKNNFYRDIFYPIMIMNSLSFPRRNTLAEATKELVGLANGAIDMANKSGEVAGVNPQIKPLNSNTAPQEVSNFLDNVMPGFRVFSSEPPSYFNIEHSAGLFKFDNCAIINFEYKYLGPWVTTTNLPQGSDAEGVRDNEGNFVGAARPQKKDFWKFWKTEKDILDISWNRVKLTFPLMAECMVTFKVLDPIFSDDWINQLSIYQEMFKAVSPDKNLSGVTKPPSTDLLDLGGLL